MHDRKSQLIAAEDAVWGHHANAALGPFDAQRLVTGAAATLGVTAPAIEFTDDGELTTRRGVVSAPPWARTPLGLAHPLAHIATDPIFPAHGAEFCANLLRVLPEALRDALGAAMDARGVHRTAERRVKQGRRELLAARRRDGDVELIMDGPPEVAIIRVVDVTRDEVRGACGTRFALARLRYAQTA